MAGQLDTLIDMKANFFFFPGHLPFAKRKKQNKEQWKIEKKPSNWINSFFQFGPVRIRCASWTKSNTMLFILLFFPVHLGPIVLNFSPPNIFRFVGRYNYTTILCSLFLPRYWVFFFFFVVVVCSRNVGHERPVDIQRLSLQLRLTVFAV